MTDGAVTYDDDPDDVMTTKSVQESSGSASYGPVVAATLWVYVGPCIFIIGLCGNSLILLVMSQKRMRGTSTCVYLQWMAVADIFALISGMVPEWVEAFYGIKFKEIDEYLCKLEKFSFYTSADASIWICVVFTIDRFIAVCFPLQQRRSCFSASNAKYWALAACLASVSKNLHVWWTRGTEHRLVEFVNGSSIETQLVFVKNCGRPTDEYRYFETYVRPLFAFTVVMAIPFCILVFCNFFIIRAMFRYRRARHMSLIVSAQDNSAFQMTALCLSASFCFLICVTPSMILLIGKPYWNDPPTDWYAIAKSITNQVVYINHSINFFLYCITGRRFRLAMWSLCRCRTSEFDRFSTDPAMGYIVATPNRSRASPSPATKRRTKLGGAVSGSTPTVGYLPPLGQLHSKTIEDPIHRKSSPAILLNLQALRRESVV